MKNTLIALITALSLLVGRVSGAVVEIQMGDLDRVTLHCLGAGLGRVNGMQIFIYQPSPNGPIGVGELTVGRIAPNTKQELDNLFQKYLPFAAQGVLTNNFGQDLDQPFRLMAWFFRFDKGANRPFDYFELDTTFSLVWSGGDYHLPDFSGMVLGFPEIIPYPTPGLKWGLMETTFRDGTSTVLNSLSGAPAEIDIGLSTLFLPRDRALCSTLEEGAVTQISLVTGEELDFQVFGPKGLPRPERLPTTRIQYLGVDGAARATEPPQQSVTLEVSGGEDGRVFEIQSAPAPEGPWESVPGTDRTAWSDSTISVEARVPSGDAMFFRAKSVRRMPVRYPPGH